MPGKGAVIDLLNEKIEKYAQSHSSSLQPMVLKIRMQDGMPLKM